MRQRQKWKLCHKCSGIAGDPAKQLVNGTRTVVEGADALKAGTGNAAEAVGKLTDNSILLASKTEEGVNQLLADPDTSG